LYQLAFATQDDSLGSLLVAVFAEAELLGGLWVISGVDPAWTHPWIMVAFAGFAASSFFRGMEGRCSCGCFGGLAINPWVALVFDLAALVVLLVSRPPTAPGVTSLDRPFHRFGMVLLAIGIGVTGWRHVDLVTAAGTAALDGQPLKDRTLMFTGESGKFFVQTDGLGGFRLPFIRSGRYAVVLSGVPRLPTSSPDPSRLAPEKTNRLRQLSSTPPGTQSRPILSWIEIYKCSMDKICINF
jgi:hypothetical protein